jgi:hypothetical protein
MRMDKNIVATLVAAIRTRLSKWYRGLQNRSSTSRRGQRPLFEKLIEQQIVKIEQGVAVTFPLGIPAVCSGTRILQYVYNEEVIDYSQNGDPRELFMGKKAAMIASRQEMITRFLARATAYLVTIFNLDGILIESYKRFLKCLDGLGYSDILPVNQGKSLTSQREAEISDFLYYRHKVFAHTSFAKPRGDSLSLQHSSLYYYSGNLLMLRERCLGLGGGSVIFNGKVENPPYVSIVGRHEEVEEHYSKWEEMFTGILDKIDRDELSGKLEGISLL